VSATREGADRLARGEAIAFPTETVYGLGADTANPQAVARIFALKGRPADHPLIVHFADPAAIDAWAIDIPPAARTQKFEARTGQRPGLLNRFGWLPEKRKTTCAGLT